MQVTIQEAAPRDPGVEELLSASHRLMQTLFPPETNAFLDFDALAAPSVTLWAAKGDGRALGTVAMMRCDGYAEVKSMFVAEEARGAGIARRLLEHLEAVARAEGISLLRLETGDLLEAAGRVYLAAGYVRCGPFGPYQENGSSHFYEKPVIPVGMSG